MTKEFDLLGHLTYKQHFGSQNREKVNFWPILTLFLTLYFGLTALWLSVRKKSVLYMDIRTPYCVGGFWSNRSLRAALASIPQKTCFWASFLVILLYKVVFVMRAPILHKFSKTILNMNSTQKLSGRASYSFFEIVTP